MTAPSVHYPIRALIIVDMQRDFTTKEGSLFVEGSDVLAELIADYATQSSARYRKIIATKDYHLPGEDNGGHFSNEPDYVKTWPEHCVQGTDGAAFHSALTNFAFKKLDAVFYKGQGRPDYSGFQGKTYDIFGEVYLDEWLRRHYINEVTIVGVATDYCVKETALDAVELGYVVNVPKLLTAAVGGSEARDEVLRQVRRAQGLDDANIW